MKLEQIKEELKKLAPDLAKKVAPVYKLLRWEWSPGETTPHIPDAPEIEKTLLDLIEGLTDEYRGCGTGGLYAYYELPDKKTGEGGEYGLIFKIEEVHSY
jgi:hypothetical protein